MAQRPNAKRGDQIGSVQQFKDAKGRPYWRARASLPEGGRVWVGPHFSRKDRAQEYAAEKTREAFASKLTLESMRPAPEPVDGETCDHYFQRLAYARKAEGVRDTRKERTIWGKWLSPRIGGRPVAQVTRDEIEAIRSALDAQVRLRIRDGLTAGISGATAQNVWSVLRTMFKETVSSRDRTLHLREDDPTAGHKPPLKTPRRQKTFVYPTEFAKLLACEAVPIEWREVYAVAAYLYVRPEELQALLWSDVDFESSTVQVSKATDARTGKPKELPKTRNAVRTVPIDPSLMPLLKRMHEGADEGAPILPVLGTLNDKFRAKQFREHLLVAGVTRSRLVADTPTLLPVDFRSCRDTGITWLALSGLDVGKMQRRAGHEDLATTLGYVKQAEDLVGKLGTPFAPLPESLTSKEPSIDSGKKSYPSVTIQESECRRRESNPPEKDESRGNSAAIVEVKSEPSDGSPCANTAKSGSVDNELDDGLGDFGRAWARH